MKTTGGTEGEGSAVPTRHPLALRRPVESAVTAFAGLLVLASGACGGPEGTASGDEDALRAPEPTVVAPGAAWTWFNDERAIVAGSHLFVGHVDTSGRSAVAVVSLESEGPARSYGLSGFREVDDHDNPALLALPDGRLLAVYAAHHVEPYWYWRVGTHQGDSVTWSPEQRTDDLGANVTYANLFGLPAEDGRIYDFFRATNFDPTLMTSDDGGATWSPPHHFLRSGDAGTRPYVKYASGGADRIDFLFTQAHPRRGETNIYHAYYRDGWLHQTDGTPIQPLPGDTVGAMEVESGTLIYDAATAGRAWVWDLERDREGHPVAVYVAARDSTVGNDLRYRYARWDAEAGRWREREIAFAGTRLYEGENHYAGGIVIDPSDPSVVYASADVDPVSGQRTAHYQLYRGSTPDGGETWSWTTLTPDATEDQIRPFVPRDTGGRQIVLWLRGSYTTYTDFATDLVGLIGR